MGKLILSAFADSLIASEIVRLGAAIKERIRAGHKVFNYTIGDFDPSQFPIPEELEAAIIQAYKEHHTAYPAAEGELDLRQSIAKFLHHYLGLDYNEKEILVSNGGRPLIYAAYKTIVDPGDKVIYPVPSWNNNHYVHFNHGEHVVIEATRENNFMPTADQIRPHIKDAVMIAVCSPLNPTGTTFSKPELENICDLIIEENKNRGDGRKKLYLLYDQIYWTLTYGNTEHYNPVSLRPEMKNYTIFIDGISKAFAATGVRVGWTMAPEEIIIKMRSLNSHVGSWAPMAEQKAVAQFLVNQPALDKYFSHFKKEISDRLYSIHAAFQKMKEEGMPVDSIEPQGGIYLTVKINLKGRKSKSGKEITDQAAVTDYILNDAELALVPFSSFGASKESAWYRLSVGCCKISDIPVMINNLHNAIGELL